MGKQFTFWEKLWAYLTEKSCRKQWSFFNWMRYNPKGGWMIAFVRGTGGKEHVWIPLEEPIEPICSYFEADCIIVAKGKKDV